MSARFELKIFLSSPGDVSDERGLARRVLDRLSQEYGLRDRVHLEEVSWDDPGAPVPLDAHLTPQEAINNRRPKAQPMRRRGRYLVVPHGDTVTFRAPQSRRDTVRLRH